MFWKRKLVDFLFLEKFDALFLITSMNITPF